MSTTGHENEAINVQGLKASLQKFKTDYVDGKAAKATTLQGYGITDAYTKNETYTKTEVNGLVSTPHQNYVTVATYASLPASGSADTIYRVSSYDGANSQVDDTVYSEYAWDGTQYVFLDVKSQIGEVFDITVYNSNTKYANLSAALGVDGANIPESLRRGGMSVKYVQSSDNKYVQYRLMSDTFNTTIANWQGVDDVPTDGSDDLVKSGGVYNSIHYTKQNLYNFIWGGINANTGAFEFALDKAVIVTENILISKNITINYPNAENKNLGWIKYYKFSGNTYIGYDTAYWGGSSANISFDVTYDGTFDNIRVGIYCDTEYNDLTNISLYVVNVESFQECSEDIYKRLDEEQSVVDAHNYIFDSITQGVPAIQDDLIDGGGLGYIQNGALMIKKLANESPMPILFKEDIIAIEFTINELWDANFVTLAFGKGKDDQNVDCYAASTMNTSVRPTEIGTIENLYSETSQPASICGRGYDGSGDYRPCLYDTKAVKVGDRCRIELIDGDFSGTVYNSITKEWDYWFFLPTDGVWFVPNRYGWNISKNIGFACRFGAFGFYQKVISDIKVLAKKGTLSEVEYLKSKDYLSKKRTWLAIGDSLTGNDGNNKCSYLGFAARKVGYTTINRGMGGFTMHALWRYRTGYERLNYPGWEDAVPNLKDGDIVTVIAGGNDWNTHDIGGSVDDPTDWLPHPRFGTTDPNAENAKDDKSTLGCLRLIIERIYELNPKVKVMVSYGTFGSKIGNGTTTSWDHMYVNADGRTAFDYGDAIHSVSREYSLHPLDLLRECGMNKQNLAQLTYDDAHLNQGGGELVGMYVASKLRELEGE